MPLCRVCLAFLRRDHRIIKQEREILARAAARFFETPAEAVDLVGKSEFPQGGRNAQERLEE